MLKTRQSTFMISNSAHNLLSISFSFLVLSLFHLFPPHLISFIYPKVTTNCNYAQIAYGKTQQL